MGHHVLEVDDGAMVIIIPKWVVWTIVAIDISSVALVLLYGAARLL